MSNSKKLILSLCDFSGAWCEPFRRAGYDVRQYDLKNGDDVVLVKKPPVRVYGILAAPPCTHLANSGGPAGALPNPRGSCYITNSKPWHVVLNTKNLNAGSRSECVAVVQAREKSLKQKPPRISCLDQVKTQDLRAPATARHGEASQRESPNVTDFTYEVMEA